MVRQWYANSSRPKNGLPLHPAVNSVVVIVVRVAVVVIIIVVAIVIIVVVVIVAVIVIVVVVGVVEPSRYVVNFVTCISQTRAMNGF